MKITIENKEGRWLVNGKRFENLSDTEIILLRRFFEEKKTALTEIAIR